MDGKSNSAQWRPTSIVRCGAVVGGSSTRVIRADTDAGPAYLKVLGNPQGPQVLARDWIGTRLAKYLGLPVFEMAIIGIPDGLPGSVYQDQRVSLTAGPALATRQESGYTWDGTDAGLKRVQNRSAVTKLVLFDTWTWNIDRKPPAGADRKANLGNVFLRYMAGGRQLQLMAIDHGECFPKPLVNAGRIDRIRDSRPYGLFDPFRQHMELELAYGTLRAVPSLADFWIGG